MEWVQGKTWEEHQRQKSDNQKQFYEDRSRIDEYLLKLFLWFTENLFGNGVMIQFGHKINCRLEDDILNEVSIG